MSTLSAFPFIPERSEATPGLWNYPFSIMSANIDAINSNLTFDASGGTFSFSSSMSVGRDLWVRGSVLVGEQPSIATGAVLKLVTDSTVSDYIQFEDSSGGRSSYLLGSRVGGTADGLNIWDLSGSTMIASFSKQSIRFYQNVVGPVFDVGGALADTYNAATFGGSETTVQIQAAISQASIDGISRVYLPASMYPYDPRKISFDTRVQMVREGGASDVYDIQAYGATPSLAVANAWSTTALQAAIHGAHGAGGGVVYVPVGTYGISSITLSRRVTLRGAGGGRDLGGTAVCLLFQNDSTVTTIIFLADQGGTGTVIEDIQIGAAAATNGGGIRIAGMEYCQIRNVSISGTSGFAIQIEGGSDTNMNAIQDCAITFTSVGSAIDIEGGPSGMDSTPYMTGCFVNTLSPAAWISIKSTSSGVAPDSALFTNNRFIESSSTITALYALATNVRFIGNRFENVGGSLIVTLAPPTGSQFAAEFIANSWAANPGRLIWNDSTTTPSTRFQEITTHGMFNTIPGTAAAPSLSFGSENSLGFYKSATSTIGLSYGALQLPAGSAVTPSLNFSSESSLGWYRSGVSSMALSYGSLRLPSGTEFLMTGTGSSPYRLWSTGGLAYLSLNRTLAFGQDTGTVASWLFQINANVGSGDGLSWSHYSSSGGASNTVWSLDSVGNQAVGFGIATNPSYKFVSETSLGFYRSGVSTIAQSYGTLNLATGGVRLSMRTLAASAVTASAAKTNVATNEVVFTIGGASGASLCISSGGTLYFFNSAGSAILA